MTLKEALAQTDSLVPNAYSQEQKTAWISELEGHILLNVQLQPLSGLRRRSYPEDLERELLLPFPYDELYTAYLRAMIDLNNGEMDRYAVSSQVYNAKYGEYVRWYARTYEPAQSLPEGTVEEEGIE